MCYRVKYDWYTEAQFHSKCCSIFSREPRKKRMFQFNFFCPLQRTQWTGWVSGGYDTQNQNFAIKQKEMSLFWHQIFVLYLWNFTSGAAFLGSNRWIATEMCDLIVQISEDLHETFKKEKKMMVSLTLDLCSCSPLNKIIFRWSRAERPTRTSRGFTGDAFKCRCWSVLFNQNEWQ